MIYGTFDGASWNEIGELIIGYKDSYKLDLAKADSEGNEVERFLATYDYVVGKYGAEYDYLGRISSGVISVSKNNSLTFEINQSIDSGTLILVVTLVTISTLGGYFFIRKRKED